MRGFTVLALLLSAACGDSTSALEGIYAIDTWTENLDSCASEGASIVDQQGQSHFLIKDVVFFGAHVLSLSTCVDLAECEARAGNKDEIFLGSALDQGSDSKGWRGTTSVVGSGSTTGDCSGEVSQLLLTNEGDASVRMETQTVSVDGISRDSDGFCSTDEAEKAAEGKPCERLEVLMGTRVEEL